MTSNYLAVYGKTGHNCSARLFVNNLVDGFPSFLEISLKLREFFRKIFSLKLRIQVVYSATNLLVAFHQQF